MKKFIKKFLGIQCFHRWKKEKTTDFSIEERCQKCGKWRRRENF